MTHVGEVVIVRSRVKILVGLIAAALSASALASVSLQSASGALATQVVTKPMTVSSYCGVNVYRKPNGTAWKCTLGEDFNGTALNSNLWRVMTSDKFGYGDRPDCFVNNRNNIYVANGVLTLTSRKERATFNCVRDGRNVRTQYSAGMVSTYSKFTQSYGRFEFRAKLPYTTQKGLQTSMWLWPQGASGASWPASGEIDVAEWYSNWPDRVIPYLHQGNIFISKSQITNNNCLVNRVQDWHTYLLEWTPDYLKISYDGRQCLYKKGGGAPFNKRYMISLFQGFGLDRNAPVAGTPSLAKAQFAWVRVWS